MTIVRTARQVAGLLERRGCKVVFAESCTGGLVSGALTAVAGVSRFHCGGVVVYRNETKAAYLGISPRVLRRPGPVSALVARQMAGSVLKKTPEADIAISVTGHLGPAAPQELDGQVFVGIAERGKARRETIVCQTHALDVHQVAGRVPRQRWVVERVLELLADRLQADLRQK